MIGCPDPQMNVVTINIKYSLRIRVDPAEADVPVDQAPSLKSVVVMATECHCEPDHSLNRPPFTNHSGLKSKKPCGGSSVPVPMDDVS